MSTGEPNGLWPQDALARAAAVLEVIAGHLLVQEEVDSAPERDLAQWIALISGHVGHAGALVADRPTDVDANRAAGAWLACAGADALSARCALAPADRDEQIRDLHAHMITAQALERSWRPAVQLAFVLSALGTLAEAATPIMTSDPDAGGPVPRARSALIEALQQLDPGMTAEVQARAHDEEPPDPVRDTSWALQDVAYAAATAAVVMHPGGAMGMPGAAG